VDVAGADVKSSIAAAIQSILESYYTGLEDHRATNLQRIRLIRSAI
jgi:hypothetical protein